MWVPDGHSLIQCNAEANNVARKFATKQFMRLKFATTAASIFAKQ